MPDKSSKNSRTLDMYARLCEGRVINKKTEAERFGVDERSIQRDIDDIRAFLADHRPQSGQDGRSIVYDRSKDGFVMQGELTSVMSNDEVLAVSKILLESRAFTRKEIGVILDKLIAGCVPLSNMKLVSELISNEKFHYVELRHKSDVNDRLWGLGEKIRECRLIELTYRKQIASRECVKRIVQPAALIFSEYYFYLIAYIVEKDGSGRYERSYDYPAVFRLDRIKSYRDTGERFTVPYAGRFEEGEFRKRVQFMFPGELMKLQLRYMGRSVEAILDRLPTARVVEEDGDAAVIEAEVYGKGVLMWLLSQGSSIEVLRPKSLREEMRKVLEQMLGMYADG